MPVPQVRLDETAEIDSQLGVVAKPRLAVVPVACTPGRRESFLECRTSRSVAAALTRADAIMEPVEILDLDRAEPTAAAEIVAVQRSGYAVESDLIGFKELPPLLESAADVALLDVVMLGARTGGQLIGVIGYRRSGDVVDVDRLVVDPAHFRQGVGTALLGELHRRESTARRFQVSTGTANTPAIRLYQSLGYRIERSEALPVGLEIVHLART